MKISLWCILFLMTLGVAQTWAGDAKPRIAVIQFSEKSSGYGSGQVGNAAEDWFTDELVNSKKFTVMERQKLQSILSEQSFQLTGAVDQLTAVKAGKLLGVQLVVFGSIDFGQKADEVNSSGLSIGGVTLPWGGGKKTTSEGNLTARLVNVQTGEIIYSDSKTVSDSSFNINIMGTGGGSSWDKTKARKVFQPAVHKLVAQMGEKIGDISSSLASAAAGLVGAIVKIKNEDVYVNLGKLDGVKTGDKFDVVRGEEITDPGTGQVLGRDEETVAQVTIKKVMGDHLATATAGTDAKIKFEKGDIIKKK